MSLCDQILLQLPHLATTAWLYKPDNYKHGAAGPISGNIASRGQQRGRPDGGI